MSRFTRTLTSSLLAAPALTLGLAVGALDTTRAQAEAPGGNAAASPALPADPAPRESGHVTANGIDYYYEIHGEGEPLLLLHGGLGNIEMFGPGLSALAGERTVIGVDLHGHGRTELGDRPISIVDMGDDMATVLRELGHETVDVMGYSMGGGVAFQLAAQHPDLVRRLVLVSVGFARDGFYPEMIPMQEQLGADMAPMMRETPMYRSYEAIAPDPARFPDLLDRMGALMRQPFDWSAEAAALDGPVMLIYGDSDMFRPEHMVAFYQLLGGGQRDAGWQGEYMSENRLAILPGLTHYTIFAAPALVETALPFLNGEGGATSWAELVESMN